MMRQPIRTGSRKVLESAQGHVRRHVKSDRRFITKSRADPRSSNNTWKVGLAVAVPSMAYLTTRTAYAESPATNKDNKKSSTISIEDMPLIRYNVSEKNLNEAKDELTKLLGKERVLEDLGSRTSHSSTAWSPAPREIDIPAFIVQPKNTEEVSAIAKICHRRKIPMIAFAGGTSLEETLAATQGGVCIDFMHMNKIVSLNASDLDVVVQPAVGYEELNEKLADEGLFFPPDPGPGAEIGGMIATGCSGTNAYRYGTMKDWVLGMTVVLADGTVVKTRQRPRKSSSGYDLTKLIVGSEGTLGFVTEANLKVTSKPRNERVAVAAFPSTHKAVETAVKIVQSDMQLGAIELLCDVTMRGVNEGGYCEKEYAEVPSLFLKFAGPTTRAVEEQIKKVQEFAKESKCKSFEFSTNAEEAEAIWSGRKTVLWSLLALKNDESDGFLSSDTAVPISRLADAVESAKKKISKAGLLGSCLGHVGDGNFHTAILYPANEEKKARKLITDIQRQAIEMGGTVTGEHGIGLEFRDMVVEELGSGGVDMMRQIKLALDPLCLLNPEKVFRLKIAEEQEK